MVVLETFSNGLKMFMVLPFILRFECRDIPLSPRSPAPLIMCIKIVSAWSSALCPKAAADDPVCLTISNRNWYLKFLAASSIDHVFLFA